MVLVPGLTVCDPDKDLLPDQPPEAVQLTEFEDVQLKTELSPCVIEVGLALKLTDGSSALSASIT